jgi:hypothetical protein
LLCCIHMYHFPEVTSLTDDRPVADGIPSLDRLTEFVKEVRA